jgi:hypothetical protein
MKSQKTHGQFYHLPVFDALTYKYLVCEFDPTAGTCSDINISGLNFISIPSDLLNASSSALCSVNIGQARNDFSVFLYTVSTDVNQLEYLYIYDSTGGGSNLTPVTQIPTPDLSVILGGGATYTGLVSSCRDVEGSYGFLPFYFAVICSYEVVQNLTTNLFFLGVSHYHVDASANLIHDHSIYYSDNLNPGLNYGNYINMNASRLRTLPYTQWYVFVTVDYSTNTFIVNYTANDPNLVQPAYTFSIPETILAFSYDWSRWVRLAIVAIVKDASGNEYLKFWMMDISNYNPTTLLWDLLFNPPSNIKASSIPHFDPGYHDFAMVKVVNTNGWYILINCFSSKTAVIDYTNDNATLYKIIDHGQIFAIYDVLFTYDNSYPSVPVILQNTFYLYGYTYESGQLVDGVFKTTDVCFFRAANTYNTFDNSKCRDYCINNIEIYNALTQTCERCLVGQYMYNGTCVPACPVLPLIITDNILMSCYYCTSLGQKYQDGVCVTACTVFNYVDYGDHCDLCPAGQYALSNTCYAICPDPYGKNTADLMCHSCTSTTNPYWYNGDCFATCPLGLGVSNNTSYTCISCATISNYLYNGVCTSMCPSLAPYVYSGSCTNVCPTGYIPNTANKCVHCLTTQYIYNGICYVNCPAGTSVSGSTCTISCPSLTPFTYNGSCASLCPTGYVPDITNTCIKCSSNQYLYNGICYTNCPIGTIANGSTCSTSCPTGQGINKAAGACVLCSSISMALYNGNCVSPCPNGLGIDSSTNTCIKCSSYIETNNCVSKCSTNNGVNKSNNTCVNCATISQYNFNGICTAQTDLPLGYIVIDDTYKIVYTCKDQNLYIYNGKCINQCPQGTKLTISTNTCDSVTLCSDGYVNINGNCVLCQSMNQVYYNNECSLACPTDYFPDSLGICKSKSSTATDNQSTLCTLPNIFKYNNQCLSTCPTNTITDQVNKTCSTDCSSSGKKFVLNGTCVDICPENYVNLNGQCVKCSDNNMFLYNNQCISTCPADTVANGSTCIASTCSDNICNGGICLISFNQATCNCQDGKMGNYCELNSTQVKQVIADLGM